MLTVNLMKINYHIGRIKRAREERDDRMAPKQRKRAKRARYH